MRARLPRHLLTCAGAAVAALAIVSLGIRSARPASAAANTFLMFGAVFTTVSDGTEVNYNIYPSKDAVYLDGGPGPGAPSDAAGLPPGTYVFQVTDPSGKILLSTDPAGCRQFTVGTGGFITDVNPSVSFGCAHATAPDLNQPGGLTVQLVPFLDSPNNGDEYKAWATPIESYLALGCSLTQVNCGYDAGTNVHGFAPRSDKTDNFKVTGQVAPEIDTRFHGDVSGALLDGRSIIHTDTLGATDVKWSYLNTVLDVNHEAHVEAAEVGTHSITINNQASCSVDDVTVTNTQTGKSYSTGVLGPQTVSVSISPSLKSGATIFVDVWCLGI